jgi:hypothetical protein
VIARVALNYPLIRARAAELGLAEPVFTELVGVSLATLRSDHGQRTISLSMLVRPARLLEISLDEFVLTDAVTLPQPARTAGEARDKGADATVVVLALPATYGGLPVAHTLRPLGWTAPALTTPWPAPPSSWRHRAASRSHRTTSGSVINRANVVTAGTSDGSDQRGNSGGRHASDRVRREAAP